MSKQIALLIDNSGSMNSPVAGAGSNSKIVQTSLGSQAFIANLVSAFNPGEDFAFSVHRFATTYELFANQTDSSSGTFLNDLNAMQASLPSIEDAAATSAAIGYLTDLFGAVRQTSDYMVANNPGFGVPDARYILLFSDGIQTIPHGGGLARTDYETSQGVTFSDLLNSRDIALRAWGIGSNALASVLRDLTNQAVNPSGESESVLGHPGSYTKVLYPESEGGIFANCETVITSTATSLVDDNGLLPVNPLGEPPSGLLWEQFSLPRRSTTEAKHGVVANFRDFEVAVDGCTRVLILGLVAHSSGKPTLQATSPGGVVFTPATPGTELVQVEMSQLFKIPEPEEGTWIVRVLGDAQGVPMILDLMARAAFKKFNLGVYVEPFQLAEKGEVRIVATPTIAGKPVVGHLEAAAHVLDGDSAVLERTEDGSFSGAVTISKPGINPIQLRVSGDIEDCGSIHRIEFTEVLLGPATDPRFRVTPGVYEQGRSYTVQFELEDERFAPTTQAFFGPDIATTGFQMLTPTLARAQIQVAPTALVGGREVVTFGPNAESIGDVRVIEARDRDRVTGRICCLRFDDAGKLVGIVLCDEREICVRAHERRLQELLEHAKEHRLTVKIHVDARDCLTEVDICR